MPTKTLNPTKDNWMDGDVVQHATNHGGAALWNVGWGPRAARPLVEFDLVGAGIPLGAVINSAIYRRYVRVPFPTVAVLVDIFRIVRFGWTELGSTWNKYAVGAGSTNDWQEPGATGALDTTTVNSVRYAMALVEGYAEENLTAMCQDGLDGGGVLGFMKKRVTESGVSEFELITSRSGTAGQEPELVVTYTTPAMLPTSGQVPTGRSGKMIPIEPFDGFALGRLSDLAMYPLFAKVQREFRRVDRNLMRLAAADGCICWFCGDLDKIPPGYHVLDGRAISRGGNPQLFEMFGTKYGAGDGGTTFNLPLLAGRVIRGVVVGEQVGETELDNTSGGSGPQIIRLLPMTRAG